MINQMLRDTLRRMNVGMSTVDPNAPIPRPGQPTNTQITQGINSEMFPAGSYVNQDIAAFNAPQTIPRPGQPVGYPIPEAPPLPGGTPMDLSGTGGGGGGWGSSPAARARTTALIRGLIAQLPSPVIPSPAPEAPQKQEPVLSYFGGPGYYGQQAMRMAGVYSPHTPPGDTYPNGLLGGRRGPFRPGGK